MKRVNIAAEDLISTHDTLRDTVRRDALTGLPNRFYLREYLGITLQNAARQSAEIGVCHFDLIAFRRLNERLGLETCDKILAHVAKVMRREVRKGDFLARLSGDEFVIITPNFSNASGLQWLGRRVAAAIAEPVVIDGATCRVTVAVGISITANGETDVGKSLADADLALREAKKSGEVALCTPELKSKRSDRLTLRDDLDRALEDGEIEPWFQPQICARTGSIDGFEALARWRHPKRGLLSPAVFIDAASEFGFGDRLAEGILDRSLNALSRWRDDGLAIPRVGVNFAADHLSDPFMVEKIKWGVEARNLQPADLCIEILESVLVDDEQVGTATNLRALARSGFHVDLDDFGTGHASIATMQRFPIDRIKIDRSFITDIDKSKDQQNIAGAMIELAHSLGVKALAEGVETTDEWSKLTAIGCDHLQGFCIGRPMPADEVTVWTTEWTRRLAATG